MTGSYPGSSSTSKTLFFTAFCFASFPPVKWSFQCEGTNFTQQGLSFVMTSVVASLRRLTRLTESERCCPKVINKLCLLTEKNYALHFNHRCQWQSAYSFLQGIYFLIQHVTSWSVFISNVLFQIIYICQNKKARVSSSHKPHYRGAISIWRQHSQEVRNGLWRRRARHLNPNTSAYWLCGVPLLTSLLGACFTIYKMGIMILIK